ncbi:MAG: MlaD family protein [Actinomycetota bacterium]|nr:MlaD family protein [Actinomycetota bacterium]
MRRIAIMLALLGALGAGFATTVAADEESHTYRLEMFNAFGIVEGSEVKVAGVNAGTVESLEVSEDKTAYVEVKLTGPLAVLGVDTQCSSEPQSLIAEYFIDCQPAGEPAEEGSVLRKKVTQTVQPDLVQNTLREPFRERLAILINEFGTALAGNPENLNEAIRLGAPALEDLHDALRVLASQNNVIRDLNVDSDKIIGTLADRRDDVSAFIENAGEAAEASAAESDNLSANFDKLDDFLAELEPTMAELENTAIQSTPLLTDLRGAAPQLNELATSLPAFNRATQESLVSLGRAAGPGTRALRTGERNGTFEALANSADQGPRTAELLSDFLRDLDDPGRAVEFDTRAEKQCGNETKSCFNTGRKGPTGYTGLEGLLNYAYYQAGALNQYDRLGHLLHFSLFDVFQGPCGRYNGQQSFPAEGGGRTDDLLEADNCVSGLGRNQPGITDGQEEADLGIPPYDPTVCPQGATDLRQDEDDPNSPLVCDPNGTSRAATRASGGEADGGGRPGGSGGSDPAGPSLPELPDLPGDLPVNPQNPGSGLGDVLDDLPGGLGKDAKKGGRGGSGGSDQAANDLLDFLFTP